MLTQDAIRVRLAQKDKCIIQLERGLEEAESDRADLRRRMIDLETSLESATDSGSYRLAHRLAHTVRIAAPAGSRRLRLLRLAYRGVRAVPKFKDRRWVWRTIKGLGRRTVTTISRGTTSERLATEHIDAARDAADPRLTSLPRFTLHDPVDVSIVITVSEPWHNMLDCLRAIAHETNGISYEVIVVVDGWSLANHHELERIKGLRVLHNELSLGFSEAANQGARMANGSYLVFSRSGVVVTSGWLDALREVFTTIPQAGCVGAKVYQPDGRLAQAGGIIWSDGTCCSYGADSAEPNHPRFNYLRQTDYCSDAALMISRELFFDLGGFDVEFSTEPYGTADLALKTRAAGHQVIYQPQSRVIAHAPLESQTCGMPLGFVDRWRDLLTHHTPSPPTGASADEHRRQMWLKSGARILVMDHRLPSVDRDAGSFRMLQMIKSLARGNHHVAFLPDDFTALPTTLIDVQSAGVEVIHSPHYASPEAYLSEHGHELDMVILSRLEVAARHISFVKHFAPQAKIVFDTVDLHFLREERQVKVNDEPELAAALEQRKRRELRLAIRSDVTLVVSPVEKLMLERECLGIDVKILSTIYPRIEPRRIPGVAHRRDIVFIGGFLHAPNVDAVLYFAREIFPMIRQELSNVVFRVIGSDAPPEIVELAASGIEILGFVPDVKPLFDRARVSVAPIRFGAGVKGKVNQSMAFGVPTVVTSMAAEGMHLVHEQSAMIADNPAMFARAVIRLLRDADLWKRISVGGQESVGRHFSVEAADRRIDQLIDELIGTERGGVAGKARRFAASLAG